jgi:hypothetical protein
MSVSCAEREAARIEDSTIFQSYSAAKVFFLFPYLAMDAHPIHAAGSLLRAVIE